MLDSRAETRYDREENGEGNENVAAHFCPQCSQEVSSAARFCPNCAAQLGSPAAGSIPAAATLDAAAQRTRRLIIPGMVLALAVLALALIMAVRRQPSVLVAAPAPAPLPAPSIVSAPVAPPAPAAPAITNAPVQPPTATPAVTNAPTRPAPMLPQDVAAYLTFLQGIEQRRIAMNNDLSGAMAMMATAQGVQGAQTDPEGGEDAAKQGTQKISQGYNDYALKWQSLIRDFRTVPAPQSCVLLSNAYLKYISDYTTVITKLQVALLNHDSSGLPDLSAVTQVQAQVNADGALADTALSDLCSGYGVPKPFSIGSDSAAPSLLGH